MAQLPKALRELCVKNGESLECRYCSASVNPGGPRESFKTLYRNHAFARCIKAQLEQERARNANLQHALDAVLSSQSGGGSGNGGGGAEYADDAASGPPAGQDPAPLEGVLVS